MALSPRYAIALTAALGIFPVALDGTIVNVATVPISQALHDDINAVQWIFLGYLLANAAAVAPSGYLANRFGIKRLFLLGIGLFTLCSALCGVAPSLNWLVALRILQGLGGGLLLPLGLAIAFEPFAAEERARASGLIAGPILLAPVLGPIIGGLIIDNWSWQAIFFINIPIGAAALLLAWRVLPKDQPAPTADSRFDYIGLIFPSIGVALLVYAFKLVSQTDPGTRTAVRPAGSIHGWGYWPVWALAGSGAALLAAFVILALRGRREGVMDPRLFARRDFTMGSLITWIGSVFMFGVLFLLPIYLQSLRLPSLSPLHTGLALLPLGIGTLIGTILGAALHRRLGARPIVVAGGLLLALGSWALRDLAPTTPISDFWPALGLVGISFTLIAVPAQTVTLAALSGSVLNKASALLQATKLLFASIGSAVLVTLFITQTTWHANRLAASTQADAPKSVGRQLLAAQAGTDALHDIFIIIIYGGLAVALVALLLPSSRDAAAIDEPTTHAA